MLHTLAKPGILTLAHTIDGRGDGAIALPNDQLFVSNHTHTATSISVYNTISFQLQRQLIINRLRPYVCGLAACATNNVLYISESLNHLIYKVDLSITSGDNVLSRWRVASYPSGLSVNRAHNVLVVCDGRVQEYTPSGSLVREIQDSNYIQHAVELNSGMLVFSRCGTVNSVDTMSIDGRVIQSYRGEQGSGVGRMDWPSGIAASKQAYSIKTT